MQIFDFATCKGYSESDIQNFINNGGISDMVKKLCFTKNVVPKLIAKCHARFFTLLLIISRSDNFRCYKLGAGLKVVKEERVPWSIFVWQDCYFI